jgi:hypothetical protein
VKSLALRAGRKSDDENEDSSSIMRGKGDRMRQGKLKGTLSELKAN